MISFDENKIIISQWTLVYLIRIEFAYSLCNSIVSPELRMKWNEDFSFLKMRISLVFRGEVRNFTFGSRMCEHKYTWTPLHSLDFLCDFVAPPVSFAQLEGQDLSRQERLAAKQLKPLVTIQLYFSLQYFFTCFGYLVGMGCFIHTCLAHGQAILYFYNIIATPHIRFLFYNLLSFLIYSILCQLTIYLFTLLSFLFWRDKCHEASHSLEALEEV